MKRGPLVAALAGAAVILVAVVGVILPKAGQVRDRQGEVTQAREQETTLRNQLGQLQQAAEDADDDRASLLELEGLVPPTADLAGLIRLVNTVAADSAVDFMAISPGQPGPGLTAGTSTVPTQITVVGGFFSVDQFLYRLETLPRAAKVTTLTIQPTVDDPASPEVEETTLQVLLGVEFYTTDVSAGPGSIPGPSDPPLADLLGPEGQPAPSPEPTLGG